MSKDKKAKPSPYQKLTASRRTVLLAYRRTVLRLIIAFGVALALFIGNSSSFAAVSREDRSHLSQASGIPLYEWKDDAIGEPKAIVVAVHGFAQDAGALSHIGQAFARQGYLVVAPDLRGHGRWAETEATMEENLQASCDDLANLLALLHKRYKKTNIYCLGESTGSGVVMSAVAKHSNGVRGIILCAAGSQPNFHNPAVMGSKFIKGMATFVSQVDIRPYLQHYLSDDARVAQEMIDDPMAKKSQSALQLIGTMSFIKDMALRAAKIPASIPVLVMQGCVDQIVLPESAESVFQAVRSKDKQFVPVEGSGHILVGTDYIKPQVLKTIETWLTKHGGIVSDMETLEKDFKRNFQHSEFRGHA